MTILSRQEQVEPVAGRRELIAWALYDFANSGYTTVVLTTIFSAYFVGVIAADTQGISLEKNQSLVGKTLDVLIEGQGDGLSMGRTYRDAPEIDGLTIIEGAYPIGDFLPVRITGAMAYDLSGVVESERSNIPVISKKTLSN